MVIGSYVDAVFLPFVLVYVLGLDLLRRAHFLLLTLTWFSVRVLISVVVG